MQIDRPIKLSSNKHPRDPDDDNMQPGRAQAGSTSKNISFAWAEFSDVVGQCNQVKCHHCKHTMSKSNATDMKKHLLFGPRCKYLESSQAKQCKNSEVVALLAKQLKQQSILDHVDSSKTSIAQAQTITQLMMDVIIQCSLPHSIVDNAIFRAWVGELRPSYLSQLPSRYQVSGQLLDKEYAVTRAEVLAQLKKADKITMTSDSWSLTQVCIQQHYETDDQAVLQVSHMD